ncbi:MAG: hypothetical protein C0174_04970 [Thermodesulfobium narugense]|nr:MAG: hypothetical protein C0174_04970 [Thermodesulfobium narugense]
MIKLILNRIKREIFLVFFIILFGTCGYMFLEHYTPIEALFMTVITITTVGYEEVKPLDNAGMLFSIILILSSFGIFAFAISRIVDYMFSSYFEEREKMKMENKLKKLKDHIIVCGYGRMGSVVAKDLRKNKKDVVIIENNPQTCELAKKDGFIAIEGNATNDEMLIKAGVKVAKSIVATTSSEPDNGFISLSAKKLNPQILVISRASNTEWISKLHLAGADEVISPHTFGARRIVNFILNPGLVEFLDILRDENIDIFMEELIVKPNSILNGKTFKSWEDLRLFLDVPSLIPLTFCIEKYNKCPHNEEFTLKESDKIIIIGSKSDIERVNKLVLQNSN